MIRKWTALLGAKQRKTASDDDSTLEQQLLVADIGASLDSQPMDESHPEDAVNGRVNQVGLRTEPTANGHAIIPREQFDSIAYLQLNPDVSLAIEQGEVESGYAHYSSCGYKEGRRLPWASNERKNSIQMMPSERSPVATKRAVVGDLDAVLIAPGAGLLIIGWISDTSSPLESIRVSCTDWRTVLDSSRFMRVRRGDVEALHGGKHAYGFIALLEFKDILNVAENVLVELWPQDGNYLEVTRHARIVPDIELRDTALEQIAQCAVFGNANVERIIALGKGLGEEIVRLNLAITSRVSARPYVERFGTAPKNIIGSIIVCLYGKAEFLFLQGALFGSLPGIADYEFIYVLNSPELAETVLREARAASLVYGIAITVVILHDNAGFGAANNAAEKFARSGRILIVNPDVFPRDLDWATKHTSLLAGAPARQTRLFGVPLYYDDGSLMHGGMYFEGDAGLTMTGGNAAACMLYRVEHYGKGAPADSNRYTQSRPVPAVTGAFISVDRSWFERLGGFTEDFVFGHYEDADLCLKSVKNGVVPYLHDIRMWHLEGKGSNRRIAHEGGSLINRWLFAQKWSATIDDGLRGKAPTHLVFANETIWGKTVGDDPSDADVSFGSVMK
jgi:GT2 family glycosyltransferase